MIQSQQRTIRENQSLASSEIDSKSFTQISPKLLRNRELFLFAYLTIFLSFTNGESPETFIETCIYKVSSNREIFFQNELIEPYRYGFNGMECDGETDGSGNAYDFGARMYDARLGRWWSVDDLWRDYSHLSVYCFTANNPIYYIDVDGNRFKVKGSEDKVTDGPNQGTSCYNLVRDDVYSLIPSNDAGKNFKAMLEISPSGEVTLNATITRDEILAINDPGITLLYSLITSENDYVYEVNYTATTKERDGDTHVENLDEPFGMSTDPTAVKRNNQISNTSNSRMLQTLPADPSGTDLAKYNSEKPADGDVEGQVVIAPVTRYVFNMGLLGTKPRSSIVLHELLENYYRTEEGLPYNADPSKGLNGAHEKAITVEDGLLDGDSRKSLSPGAGDVTNDPGRK